MDVRWSHICMFCVLLGSVVSQDLLDFNQCCYYCRGDQGEATTVRPSWELHHRELVITNFSTPVSVFPQNAVSQWLSVAGKEYQIQYGGVPIHVTIQDMTDHTSLLNDQYIQMAVDDGEDVVVSGVVTEAGFYHEETNTLVAPLVTWLARFTVSYLPPHSDSFIFLRDSTNNIIVFDEDSGPSGQVVHNLPHLIQTSAVRLHPLEVRDEEGPVNHAIIRAGLIYCTTGQCSVDVSHCEVDVWGAWSECMCRGEEGCYQTRTRGVLRYNTCGGDSTCPHLTDTQTCQLPEALWVTVVKWLSLAIALLLLVVLVLALTLHKLHINKKRKAFKKSREARLKEKQEKEREKDAQLFTQADTMDNKSMSEAFEEREIAMRRERGHQVVNWEERREEGTATTKAINTPSLVDVRGREDDDLVEDEMVKMTEKTGQDSWMGNFNFNQI